MPDDIRAAPDEALIRLPSDPMEVDPTRVGPVEVDPVVVGSFEVAAPVEPAVAVPTHVVSPARRRALMPWAVVASILVVLGAVAIGLTYTPMFHARSITVSGERRLSEQRILRIAGIGPGTDVFHADLSAIEHRLERDPWIADAVVSRRLPSAISVEVVERRPVALSRSADGPMVYLAVDGTVLAPARGNVLLPEVLPTAETSTDLLAVAQALPRGLVSEVAAISLDQQGAVVLEMRSGVMATYGDGSQPEAKGEALKAVLDYADNNGHALVSVDVRVPGAPTAVFAPSTPSP